MCGRPCWVAFCVSHLLPTSQPLLTHTLYASLTPRPIKLFYHFFNVAFYSIYLLLIHGPPQRRTKGAAGAIVMFPLNLLLSFKVVRVLFSHSPSCGAPGLMIGLDDSSTRLAWSCCRSCLSNLEVRAYIHE